MNDTLLATKWGTGFLIALELVLVTVVIALAKRTTLLRDSVAGEPVAERPYSMAKSQLAFWLVVIVGSFLYIYFATNVFSDVLNNTALILLGLSTGTTALAAAAAKPATEPSAPPPVVASGAPAPAGQDHKPPTPAHENFLDDILSDNEGMNVHRLQMLIWTVILGFIFIHQVARSTKFPIFDEQHYYLMGISSATYVWFKRTEK